MSHEECLLRFRMRMNEDGHVIPRSQPLCNGGGRDCVLKKPQLMSLDLQVLWGRVTLASPRRQGDLVSRSVGRLDSLQRLGTSTGVGFSSQNGTHRVLLFLVINVATVVPCLRTACPISNARRGCYADRKLVELMQEESPDVDG